MGKFNTKRERSADASPALVPASWPTDTLDEIDDTAFAAAIEQGRVAESARRVTVAA